MSRLYHYTCVRNPYFKAASAFCCDATYPVLGFGPDQAPAGPRPRVEAIQRGGPEQALNEPVGLALHVERWAEPTAAVELIYSRPGYYLDADPACAISDSGNLAVVGEEERRGWQEIGVNVTSLCDKWPNAETC